MRFQLFLLVLFLAVAIDSGTAFAGDFVNLTGSTASDKKNSDGKFAPVGDAQVTPPDGTASGPIPSPDTAEAEEGAKVGKVNLQPLAVSGERSVAP